MTEYTQHIVHHVGSRAGNALLIGLAVLVWLMIVGAFVTAWVVVSNLPG